MDLTALVYATTGFFTLYSIYYFILFASTLRRGDESERRGGEVRFLVLVPAHDEEDVIGEICGDLVCQEYPEELFRVIVVADNCGDRTAEVVRGMECATLKLLERRSEVRGKGAALDYAIENAHRLLGGFKPEYAVVFDADNRVPEYFLGSLSSRVGGNAALQCNVKTKNPTSSLISRASYYEGLILQRLWQRGKDRIGFCTALAGTGEVIRYGLISEFKFGNSLTDDLDLTVRLAKAGIRVKYLHYPCTYDEKPDCLRVEIRRRIRWAAGHFQTFFRHGIGLMRRPSRLSLDAFFYLTNIISPLVVLTSWLASALVAMGFAEISPIPPAYSVAMSLAIFPILAVVSFLEGDRHFIRNMPIFYAFMAIWFIAAPVGLVKALFGGAKWERTPHKFTSARIEGVRVGPLGAPRLGAFPCTGKKN